MTSPFIIREPSFAEQIQPGVATLMAALQNRQQLGIQRQQLELERQRTESQTELDAAQRKKILDELKQREINNRAQDFASSEFITVTTTPGGFSPENIAAAQQRIMKNADKEVVSETLAAFNGFVQRRDEALKLAAERAQQEQEAEFGAETLEERIQLQEMAPELAAQEAAQRERDLALREQEHVTRQQGLDLDRRQAAERAFEQGQRPWGEIRELFGVPPTSRPDDTVFQSAVGAAANESMRKARNFATLMSAAHLQINALVEKTGGVSARARLIIDGWGGPIGDLLINPTLSADQQQLITAQRQFANAFRYFVSGQQTSDKEFKVILGQTVENFGDKPETKAQKRIMREIMIEAADEMAGIGADPYEVMTRFIERARRERLPAAYIKSLESERAKARDLVRFADRNGITLDEARELRRLEAQQDGKAELDDVTFAPSTPGTLGADSAWVDNTIRNLLAGDQ